LQGATGEHVLAGEPHEAQRHIEEVKRARQGPARKFRHARNEDRSRYVQYAPRDAVGKLEFAAQRSKSAGRRTASGQNVGADPLSKRRDVRLPASFPHLPRQWRVQEIPGQREADVNPALDPKRSGARRDHGPLDGRLATQHLGDIHQPSERGPAVLAAMDA